MFVKLAQSCYHICQLNFKRPQNNDVLHKFQGVQVNEDMGNDKHLTLFASWHSKDRARFSAALRFVLLIVPVGIGLAWGTYFDDSTYVTFRYARNLAIGRGLVYNWAARAPQTPLDSPLYALILALPAAMRISLPRASLILSTLGWGITATMIYTTGRAMRQPVVAAVSATLVAFSPVILSTLGTEIPWTAGFAWIAIASSVKKQWYIQTGMLALMLCIHLDLTTLSLALLLLASRWIERERFPLRSSLILVFGCGLVATIHRDFFTILDIQRWSVVSAQWRYDIRQLLDESEFYWLFLPLLLCGVIELLAMRSAVPMRKRWWIGLPYSAGIVISILSGGATARTLLATLGLFLAGLGIGWLIKWLGTRDAVRLDYLTLATSLLFVIGLSLSIAQVSSLYQRYQSRPIVRQELEQRAGDWLRVHSKATEIVFGSERVGYLADRSTFSWDGGKSDQAKLVSLLQALNETRPGYWVSFKSISWGHLMRTEWFQDSYVSLKKFESPYDAASPVTIWGYRLRAFDSGKHRPLPLNVHLPGRVDLVGYRYWPDRIQPGDVVSVTLFLQATHPITESFQTIVRAISPNDGVAWAQQDTIISPSALMDSQETGQVIAEQLVLTTTVGIPVGVYHINVSVAATHNPQHSVLPIYQNDDTSPLDQIILGNVTVPWQGTLDAVQLVNANFGNQINLLGFEAADSLLPGSEFDVTLYWEARHPPNDDYVVFVYLLDANGQSIAQHDGPPMNGQYTTKMWLPGEIVPDVHRIVLDDHTPVGTYQLHAGMYRWPSLERLPVWDSQEIEQADRVIFLQPIRVQ